MELTTEDVPEVKVLQDDQETHQHNFLEVLNKKKKVNVNEKTNKEEESERLNFVDYPPPQPSQKAEKPFNLAVAEDEVSYVKEWIILPILHVPIIIFYDFIIYLLFFEQSVRKNDRYWNWKPLK